MGGSDSKAANTQKADTAENFVEQGGFHLFEVHSQTAGFNILTSLVISAIVLGLYLLCRKCRACMTAFAHERAQMRQIISSHDSSRRSSLFRRRFDDLQMSPYTSNRPSLPSPYNDDFRQQTSRIQDITERPRASSSAASRVNWDDITKSRTTNESKQSDC